VPVLIQPIADADLELFEPTPAIELDLGLSQSTKTTIGGWIEVGYHGGAFGQ
jgi:hypothetical protein